MSIYRTLIVDEILDLILQEIVCDKAALASMARTCGWISEMALDFLWRELDTSTPVKKLLPNLWDKEGNYRESTHPEEWKRFDKYARKIEVLGTDELDARERYLWQLYSQVCKLRPGVVPFPKLRKLRLYQDFEQPDRESSLLLFPASLRQLRVDFGSRIWNGSLRVAEGYLIAAARQVHLLEHLSLHGDISSTSFISVMEHQHLRILDLRHTKTSDVLVYQNLIVAASTMKWLTHLYLPKREITKDIESRKPRFTGFRRLESLYMHSDVACLSSLLGALTAPRLRSIIFHSGYTRSHVLEWRECADMLRSHHRTSLRIINIHSRILWDGNEYLLAVEPLLQLDQLEEAILDFDSSVTVQVVQLMASSWRCLRQLTLKSVITAATNEPETLSESSYNCLLSFAQFCPALIFLELTFGYQERVPDVDDWPSSFSHGLEVLKLIHVPFDSREKLSLILNRIFPRLVDSVPRWC